MEFNEKLQQLRKEKSMTQEQLAEELFVSRTAISKWENGKGYPNIDSLKSISALFSISIDDLLSGEELISLAVEENRKNIKKLSSLIYGVLDLMGLALLFLPLFGQPDGEGVQVVNLFAFKDASSITRAIYFILPISMALLGMVELATQYFSSEKWLNAGKLASILLQAFAIFVFINTRQPYATSLVFMFFMIKVVLLIKGKY
ncbi:helix-turn-helix transcriptional regulator [Aminipila butyrica]|uniref:Helix-turn-helix transcriptional regulator n=1 Tax=Aminipila butyrica TaxID=433296 RepID=A0A858BUM0_9FIRM|nr:helix-turn-helix transcriptional regulator [Aminipila butyrica]QIB68889.1 helix-turn-helix transcriptional regulator [Aminipila butyrica]